jgi:hypothetical protein
MNAPMPVLRALMGGAKIWPLARSLYEGSEPGGPYGYPTMPKGGLYHDESIQLADDIRVDFVREITSCVPFDIQLASDIFWGRYEDKPHGPRREMDFGSLRMPYPHMWLEWDVSSEAGNQIFHGLMLNETAMDEHIVPEGRRPAAHHMEMSLFLHPAKHPDKVLFNEILQDIYLDEDGRYTYSSQIEVPNNLKDRPDLIKVAQDLIRRAEFTVSEALHLMNCRNVSTEVAGKIPMRRSGRAKRAGARPVEYHHIKLPGMPKLTGLSRRDREAYQAALRLHKVKGHYKHFGPEFGTGLLFGRLAGTFWWGWQERGDINEGVIFSDYELARGDES